MSEAKLETVRAMRPYDERRLAPIGGIKIGDRADWPDFELRCDSAGLEIRALKASENPIGDAYPVRVRAKSGLPGWPVDARGEPRWAWALAACNRRSQGLMFLVQGDLGLPLLFDGLPQATRAARAREVIWKESMVGEAQLKARHQILLRIRRAFLSGDPELAGSLSKRLEELVADRD